MTVKVRFLVPANDQWAIWANGGELMGEFDVGERRGNIPMGIDIGADGSTRLVVPAPTCP